MACGTRTLEARLGRLGDAGTDGDTTVEYDSGIPDRPGVEATLVVSYYRLGITTREDVASDTAWKDYGFDLDSVCTTADDSATSKGTCRRIEGSKPGVLEDGNDCRDNNFGSQLVPLLKTFSPGTEPNILAGIKKGGLTLAVRISDLAETGEDGRAPAAFLAVKGQGGAAKLDGTDILDVDGTSVTDGDLSKPTTSLVGGVRLVDGKRVWITKIDLLPLPAVFIAGATGSVPMHGARLEIELDTVPMRGTIAGWVLIKDAQDLVGSLLRGRSLCPGNPLYEQVAKDVAQSADMPLTLPQDPTKDCEAISLAFGLELVKGKLGKVLDPSPPPKDPCAP
jgi:hypothetical protein